MLCYKDKVQNCLDKQLLQIAGTLHPANSKLTASNLTAISDVNAHMQMMLPFQRKDIVWIWSSGLVDLEYLEEALTSV